MKELLNTIKKYDFEDYAMMNVVTKKEGQNFLDWLCERDLINEGRIRILKDRWDADYFGHAQHVVVDGNVFHLVTLLSPVWMVLIHEVAHCLVFKCDPEWAQAHVNSHGKEFEKALLTAYFLYKDFKGAF